MNWAGKTDRKGGQGPIQPSICGRSRAPVPLPIQVNVAPAKCLFLVDGVPVGDVIQALCENTPDRTQDVILIFERPAKKPMSGPWF
eukprot:scaffold294132_cov40-Tisochrysis_lutea.AAC.1